MAFGGESLKANWLVGRGSAPVFSDFGLHAPAPAPAEIAE